MPTGLWSRTLRKRGQREGGYPLNNQTSLRLVAVPPAPATRAAESPAPSLPHFLRSLFALLEANRVRYCVLHGYGRLPFALSGDLDLAVHPDDLNRVPGVLHDLTGDRYLALQCFEYAVGGHYFVFGWFDGSQLQTIAVDFITEHRRGGLILASGAELVTGRQRRDDFWVPAPETEFSYLLAKRSCKGLCSQKHAVRLHRLAGGLGLEVAERIAARLFGERGGKQIADACSKGELAELLPAMRKRLWLAAVAKDWSNPIRYAAAEALRVIHRWRRPSGLFVAILGPDGAGKSTLATGLVAATRGAFRRYRLFHLRPMLLGRRKFGGPVTDPHGRPPRSSLVSTLKLLAYVLDYALGYWMVIRPLVARSGLVVFDRYYQDLLADPRRFRFSGPAWMVRMLGRLVPSPDLVLLLDAPPAVTLSRKREVEPAEARRQRQAYLSLAAGIPAANAIAAAGAAPQVRDQSTRIVTRHLAERFRKQHGRWIAKQRNSSAAGAAPAVPRPVVSRPVVSRNEALRRTLTILTAARPAPRSPRPAPDTASRPRQPQGRAFAVVPSSRNPRWLLPIDSPRSAAAGLDFCAVYSPRARLLKNALRLFLRSPCSNLLLNQIEVSHESLAALEDLIEKALGVKTPTFAMSIPAPGRKCKATIQIMSRDGEILGFLKVPLTDGAAERTRHEAFTLRRLACFPELQSSVPEVLFAGDWNGAYVLLQSPLPGRPAGSRFSIRHHEFLRKLQAANRAVRSGEDLVAMTGKRWRKLARDADGDWVDAGERALEYAGCRLASTAVACGISHGDFAPWNLRLQGNSLRAFDWENANWNAPAHWDWFHFQVQVRANLGPGFQTPLLRCFPESLQPLFTLYLLNSLCDGYDEGMAEKGLRYRQRLLSGLVESEAVRALTVSASP